MRIKPEVVGLGGGDAEGDCGVGGQRRRQIREGWRGVGGTEKEADKGEMEGGGAEKETDKGGMEGGGGTEKKTEKGGMEGGGGGGEELNGVTDGHNRPFGTANI